MTKTSGISEYLEKPFSRVLIPDPESGTYSARILEFPGCVAEGETVEEAYAKLEDAAENWIVAALDLGQDIPTPVVEHQYSGRVLLRLPKSLHQRCAELADREGTSLNKFIVTTLAERVGAITARAANVPRHTSAALGVFGHWNVMGSDPVDWTVLKNLGQLQVNLRSPVITTDAEITTAPGPNVDFMRQVFVDRGATVAAAGTLLIEKEGNPWQR